MDDQPLPGGGAAGDAEMVLVCDYVGRRPEAPVASLDLESQGYTVHYLLKHPYVRRLTATTYAEELLRRCSPFGGQVRAVLAYCTAAPIAQELAAAICATTDEKVPLVLFDGEPATVQAIEQQYCLVGERLSEVLDLPAGERTPPPAFDGALLRDRPEEALRRIHEGLLHLGDRAVTRGSGDPDVIRADAAAIAEFSLDWLSHLIAAHNASWSAWGGPAVQVVSRDHPCVADWPGATRTETVRIATTRNDLLRHPDVASTVLSILREGPGHAS